MGPARTTARCDFTDLMGNPPHRRPAANAQIVDQFNNGRDFNPPAEPDVNAYSAAITACEKGGQPDTALKLFDQLLDEGPRLKSPAHPDAITYSTALAACEKAGRTDRYAELLRLGMGSPLTPGTQVFRPNLGFDSKKNILDFHESAVLTEPTNDAGVRDKGVHPAVDKAIFHVLFTQPQVILGPNAQGINDKTIFGVGGTARTQSGKPSSIA